MTAKQIAKKASRAFSLKPKAVENFNEKANDPKINPNAIAVVGGKKGGLHLPRTGDAIDRILSFYPKKWADALERRRTEDAVSHLEAVKAKLTPDEQAKLAGHGLSFAQADAFSKAVEGASEFSFETDPILSAAWRSAIEISLSDAALSKIISRVLSTIDPLTLRAFLRSVDSESSLPFISKAVIGSSESKALESYGVLKVADEKIRLLFRGGLLNGMLWLLVSVTGKLFFDTILPAYEGYNPSIKLVQDNWLAITIATGLAWLTLILLRLDRLRDQLQLTEVGVALATGYRKHKPR